MATTPESPELRLSKGGGGGGGVGGIYIRRGRTQTGMNLYRYETLCSPLHETGTRCAPVAQLVEHRAVTREVVSSTPAGPTLKVFK